MRNRWMLLLAVAALALPASASAATLGEVAPLTLRGNEDCAGTTGAPGELVVATKTGVRFVSATRAGFQLGQALDLGPNFECQAVKVRPSGAGVIVGDVQGAIVAVVRDPGGTWSAPATISKTNSSAYSLYASADVSDRGDVIVAYKESRYGEEEHTRFKVARRAPGQTFGAEQQIGTSSEKLGDIVAGIAATGEAFLVTSAIKNDRVPFQVPVDVRIAPPGGAFGVPVHLATTHLLSGASLDVAADGRALVATVQGSSVVVAERAPGEGFGAPVPVGTIGDTTLASASVTLGPGGSAAIVWLRVPPADVQVVTRAAPGAFSAPVIAYDASGLLPATFDPFYLSETFLASLLGGGASTSSGDFDLALTPDGRVALAVTGTRTTLTSVPLAGGPAVSATTGTVFGSSTDGATLVLADGTPAAFWTESATGQFGGLIDDSQAYRLHLAAEGVTERPDPPTPRVTLGAPTTRTVGETGLRLPVTCSAACRVVAEMDSDLGPLGAVVQMTRAGRRTLTIEGAALAAPERLGPVHIRPSLRRARRAAPARANRDGAGQARRPGSKSRACPPSERAAWATGSASPSGSPTGSDELFVSGDDTRDWSGEPLVTRTITAKPGKRDYTVTLPAKGVKFVIVRVPFAFSSLSKTVVRVR